MMKNVTFLMAVVILIGLIAALGFAYLFAFKTTEINPSICANYGSLIAGTVGILFSLLGVILIYLNLRAQNKAFLKQQIENRFFELVAITRENSSNIRKRAKRGDGTPCVKRIVALLGEFYDCLAILQKIGIKHGLKEDEAINLAYLCFFNGAIGERSETMLRHRLQDRYAPSVLDDLFTTFKDEARNYKYGYRPFNGHQLIFGHYYRHLFQTVTYIDNQPERLLTPDEKYQYVKTLRAQLSTQEQVLLFFNSVSDLGLRWERDPSIRDENKRLITKYNLIRNIPYGFIKDIDFRKYYPNVRYEDNPAHPQRGKAP